MECIVRQKTNISKNRFGFMLEKSTMEVIVTLTNDGKISREEEKSPYGLYPRKFITRYLEI